MLKRRSTGGGAVGYKLNRYAVNTLQTTKFQAFEGLFDYLDRVGIARPTD